MHGFATYTLIELPISSFRHCRLVSSVDAINMVPLNLSHFVHGNIACKGNLQVSSNEGNYCSS